MRTWIRGVAPGRRYLAALKFPMYGVVACSCNAGAVGLSGLRDTRIRILTPWDILSVTR